MSAVQEARRGLIAAGFGSALSAAAASPGSINGATPDQERALLVEIARYIDDTDPLMIGAAWLLEQSGCERSQMDLLGGREL